jgi:hypothetical protein
MTDRELMQQALEALDQVAEAMPFPVAQRIRAALSERLAQPEQTPLDRMADNARELGLDYEPQHTQKYVTEPVAWGRNSFIEDDNGVPIGTDDPELIWGKYLPDDDGGWWPLYTAPNTKVNSEAIPEQISEPVAVVKTLSMGEGKPPFHYIECRHLPEGTPLYTAPQPALSKEPVGWFFTGQDGSEYCSEKDSREGVWTPLFTKANFEATPKQISEPVAMRFDFDGYGYQYIDSGSGSNWQTRHKDAEPLYTAPQRREWVGLTEEEIYPLYSEPSSDAEMVEFARAIEAKLREKNTCPT